MQSPLFAEPLAQHLLSSPMHEYASSVTNDKRVAVLDDMLMPQFLQDFALVFEALVVCGIAGRLEYILLAVALDEQGHRASALAEALENREVPWQPVFDLCASRVFDEALFRGCQLVFHLVQVAQEVDHRVDAVRNLGMRAVLDEELQVLTSTVQDRADLQAFGLA